PPSIYPFSIQNSLHLGERIGLQCIVTKGDPPLAITWLKDDQPINELPNLTMKSLGEYSSTLMIEQLSTAHSGRYTCTARNAAASAAHTNREPFLVSIENVSRPTERAEAALGSPLSFLPFYALFLACSHSSNFAVPPEITPFHFQELTEGARVQVQCIVQRGDLPLNITWMKNYEPLVTDHNNHIHITDFNTYSSILTIGSVSLYHRGNYTCLARNPARMVSHTSQLKISGNVHTHTFICPYILVQVIVDVEIGRGQPAELRAGKPPNNPAPLLLLPKSLPPEWLTEPKDTSAIAGHPVGLHCQADGFPTPKTTWRKAPGKHPAHFAPINSRDGLVTVLNNGTLLIRSVLEEHEGYYLCEANNGIGAGLSAVVFLTVNGKYISYEKILR
ncbi:hypothetical protein J437_LFUL011496, partial [Ladona fulva]